MRGFTRVMMLAACTGWLLSTPAIAEDGFEPETFETSGRVVPHDTGVDQKALLRPVHLCRNIQHHAASEGLPLMFFARLIWRESRFDPDAVSHAGAQGIAQFMPGTAKDRGLRNPFDPAQALPESAELLADHFREFGNVGLAAAAYNAGPGRVQKWLAGKSGLPGETRKYVKYITGQPASYWKNKNPAQPVTLARDPAAVEDWCLAQPAPIWATPWPRNAWNLWVANDLSLREATEKVERLKDTLGARRSKSVRPLVVPLDKADADGAPRFGVTLNVRTQSGAETICTLLLAGKKACRIMRG